MPIRTITFTEQDIIDALSQHSYDAYEYIDADETMTAFRWDAESGQFVATVSFEPVGPPVSLRFGYQDAEYNGVTLTYSQISQRLKECVDAKQIKPDDGMAVAVLLQDGRMLYAGFSPRSVRGKFAPILDLLFSRTTTNGQETRPEAVQAQQAQPDRQAPKGMPVWQTQEQGQGFMLVRYVTFDGSSS